MTIEIDMGVVRDLIAKHNDSELFTIDEMTLCTGTGIRITKGAITDDMATNRALPNLDIIPFTKGDSSNLYERLRISNSGRGNDFTSTEKAVTKVLKRLDRAYTRYTDDIEFVKHAKKVAEDMTTELGHTWEIHGLSMIRPDSLATGVIFANDGNDKFFVDAGGVEWHIVQTMIEHREPDAYIEIKGKLDGYHVRVNGLNMSTLKKLVVFLEKNGFVGETI